MKTCGKCKQLKLESEFHSDRSSKDGLYRKCRVCAALQRKRWREANLEYDKAQNKKYREENKSELSKKQRSRALKRDYGILPEDFDQIQLNQQDKCAICAEEFFKTPHVDHDHATGKVRGLLCTKCNMAIGLLADSPERLRAAAEYLDKANPLK